MGSYVGQIFPTASLHRDHSILYALVYEKEISHMDKTTEIPIWCARICFLNVHRFLWKIDIPTLSEKGKYFKEVNLLRIMPIRKLQSAIIV